MNIPNLITLSNWVTLLVRTDTVYTNLLNNNDFISFIYSFISLIGIDIFSSFDLVVKYVPGGVVSVCCGWEVVVVVGGVSEVPGVTVTGELGFAAGVTFGVGGCMLDVVVSDGLSVWTSWLVDGVWGLLVVTVGVVGWTGVWGSLW